MRETIEIEDFIEDFDQPTYRGMRVKDGFNLAYAVMPETFADFVDLVVPELQRRGRYKRDYAPGTLREKLFGQGRRRARAPPIVGPGECGSYRHNRPANAPGSTGVRTRNPSRHLHSSCYDRLGGQCLFWDTPPADVPAPEHRDRPVAPAAASRPNVARGTIPLLRVSAASPMIALKPAVGCVSGSAARLSSVTPSAPNARRK
jgi:hypothetical protein